MDQASKYSVIPGRWWVHGRMPGPASAYKEEFSRDFLIQVFSYQTKKEAVRALLPPPLMPIDGVLDVYCLIAEGYGYRSYDGRRKRYNEFAWLIPCQYKGIKGTIMPICYKSSTNGLDPSWGGEAACAYRETMGFFTRMADVRVFGVGMDCGATVNIAGMRLGEITFKFTETVEEAPEFFKRDYFQNFLFVKEIPNCDFTGYDVRKVIAAPATMMHGRTLSMRTGKATLNMFHLDSDPIAILEVVKPGIAFEVVVDMLHQGPGPAGSASAYEVEDLLKK